MDRRNFVYGLSAVAATVAVPSVPALAANPSSAKVATLISQMVAAFTVETLSYRRIREELGEVADEEANRLTGSASAAAERLLDLPAAEAINHPDYLPALALNHRRLLVIEGSYADRAKRNECLLVDAALAGHRFDAVPLLWHIRGEQWDRRPADAEFAAAMAPNESEPSPAEVVLPPQRRLLILASTFANDVKAIDPGITAVWFGNDSLPKHRGANSNLYFLREF